MTASSPGFELGLARPKRRRVLPGFGLSLGLTLFWLGIVIILPLAVLVAKVFELDLATFFATVTRPDVLAAFKLSFGASLLAAVINLFFGTVTAWVLVRYRFPGHGLVDALIDIPFALPTAVAGIALAVGFGPETPLPLASSWMGVTLALTFVSLPFVIRTVQPVLEQLPKDAEEAAATLGASRWTTFRSVVLPALRPALATGFALSFARAVGEYGSVIFIAGNLPLKTEIAPLKIMQALDGGDAHPEARAAAIAVVMLVVSFIVLLALTVLQKKAVKR